VASGNVVEARSEDATCEPTEVRAAVERAALDIFTATGPSCACLSPALGE
jgi:hypothetical protein